MEKRLDNRTFFIGLVSGLSRINKGFLFTAWNLLIRPWRVIRDYICCRRVRYVSPVSMLILVCFISAVLGALVSAESHPTVTADIDRPDIPLIYRIMLSAGQFFLSNALAQNLTIYIPALLAIPIVYRRHGAMKYNLAEYLTAMIYMASSFLIFDIVSLPLSALSETLYSSASLCYSIVICALSMYHAFPGTSVRSRVARFALYLLVVLLIYVLLLGLLGLILGLGMASR